MDDELLRLTARVQGSHWWFRGRAEIVRRLVRARHPPGRDGTVVDVGCGTGATLGALGPGYRRVGVDGSPTALEFARRSCPGAEFIRATLPDEAHRVPDDGDVYLVMDVLEHLEDDREALAALWSRLPTGAALFVTVPAGPDLWSSHDVSHGHHRRYTRADLDRLLGLFPGEIRLLSYFNSRLYPALWLARKLGRLVGRSLGAGGTDLHLAPEPLNEALRKVFAGEGDRLSEAIVEPGRAVESVYRRGMSLIALVEVAASRSKPPVRPGDESPARTESAERPGDDRDGKDGSPGPRPRGT